MASPSASCAQQVDAQLVCAICSDRYKTPKVLVCLHSFCQECLRKQVHHDPETGNPLINCPLCQCATDVPSNGATDVPSNGATDVPSNGATDVPSNGATDVPSNGAIGVPSNSATDVPSNGATDVPSNGATDVPSDGVEGLPTNFTLSNIVEVMDIHDTEGEKAQSSGKICENGLDSNPAVVHCPDCKCFLCQTCLENHKKMKGTKNHRCVSLREIKEDVRKMEQKRYCAKHEEELKLYCKTCQEVICRDCTIVTHKGHVYDFVKDVRDELVKEMQQLLDKVKTKEAEFAGHQAHLQNVESTNKENIKQCRQMVNQFFADWIQRLHAKKEDLLQNIDVLSGENSKKLMSENDAVNLIVFQMGGPINFTRQLLDSGTPVDIAMMSKRTCKQLNVVQQLEWDPKNVRPRKYEFVSSDTNPLTACVQGGIYPDEIIVEGLHQLILGKNTFNIRVLGDVEIGVVVVTVEAANGEQVGNPQKKKNGNREWTVTYTIPGDGHYKISVSVDGVEAKGVPFKRVWKSKLPWGTKVRRGRDWKYKDQDGGPRGTGEVIAGLSSLGWVKVKWDNGKAWNYRWGADGCFDLEIIL